MLSIAVKQLLLEQWKGEQKPHAEYYLLFPGNMSSTIAIDEVSLTKGELYTIISSLARSGRKGNLIAVVAGTNGEDLITVLSRLPKAQRNTIGRVNFRHVSYYAQSLRILVFICQVGYR